MGGVALDLVLVLEQPGPAVVLRGLGRLALREQRIERKHVRLVRGPEQVRDALLCLVDDLHSLVKRLDRLGARGRVADVEEPCPADKERGRGRPAMLLQHVAHEDHRLDGALLEAREARLRRVGNRPLCA